jgi:hypothetical protein
LRSFGIDPVIKIGSRLGLASLGQEFGHEYVTLRPRLQLAGLLAHVLGPRREPALKWSILFEPTPNLHSAAPLFEWGGSAIGVLITDKCHGSGGDSAEYVPKLALRPAILFSIRQEPNRLSMNPAMLVCDSESDATKGMQEERAMLMRTLMRCHLVFRQRPDWSGNQAEGWNPGRIP